MLSLLQNHSMISQAGDRIWNQEDGLALERNLEVEGCSSLVFLWWTLILATNNQKEEGTYHDIPVLLEEK